MREGLRRKRKEELKQMLREMDHKGYPAYKSLKGSYEFGDYVLEILHVQSDPFAPASRLCITVPGRLAGFPGEYYQKKHRRIALQDYLNRRMYGEIEKYQRKTAGSGKSGMIGISRCTQEILERSAMTIDPDTGSVQAKIAVGFPANGRTITAERLVRILFEFLPACVENALYYRKLSANEVKKIIDLSDDQQYIRDVLDEMGLCAFVANGSILPRKSGISSLPMKGAIPFVSPKSMEVTLSLPHRGRIAGMGIKKGITLIVGGGYHGKSTLLQALETGVYNHIQGDGREYVICDETAFKIRSEDGRSIKRTDISMFINHLPNQTDTKHFYSEDASGSTSQAANVIESIESGSKVFLIDEDTCATNFMIRDELMQRVVSREKEPITPFIDRARSLYEMYGISSVIVAGSSGAYFYIADTILQMDQYRPKDITEMAKREAEKFVSVVQRLELPDRPDFHRVPSGNELLKKKDRYKIKSRGREAIQLEHEEVELRYLEQLLDSEQAAALSYMLLLAEKKLMDGKKTVAELTQELYQTAQGNAMEGLSVERSLLADLAMPRPQEIAACLNRYRGLKL